MAKVLILVASLASFPGQGSDWSGWPTLNKMQLVGLVILGGTIVNAWAASNATNITQVLCTDEFIIASTWLGNAYGIVDTLAWTLDFISGYIFYAKGDTKEVKSLKKNINKIKKQHHKTHEERINITVEVCDKIITYIETRGSGHNHHNSLEKKEEIIDCINFARRIFSEELKNREEIAIAL